MNKTSFHKNHRIQRLRMLGMKIGIEVIEFIWMLFFFLVLTYCYPLLIGERLFEVFILATIIYLLGVVARIIHILLQRN
jgi:hypothetical protein